MRWTLTFALALAVDFLSGSAAGAADPVRIAAGPEGGTYLEVYTERLGEALEGRSIDAIMTAGTSANVRLIAAGDADFGFAQADVLADMLLGDPDLFSRLEVLGAMGAECVFMAAAKHGPIDKLGDVSRMLDGRHARVAVGPEQSGTFGTWRYLSHLSPRLSSAETFKDQGRAAIDKLARGDLDAVVWVTDPANRSHDMRRAVSEHRDLRFVSVAGDGMSNTLPNGIRVYSTEKLRLGEWPFGRRLKTLCTRALLIGRIDLDGDLEERAVEIVTLSREDLVRGKGGL